MRQRSVLCWSPRALRQLEREHWPQVIAQYQCLTVVTCGRLIFNTILCHANADSGITHLQQVKSRFICTAH